MGKGVDKMGRFNCPVDCVHKDRQIKEYPCKECMYGVKDKLNHYKARNNC